MEQNEQQEIKNFSKRIENMLTVEKKSLVRRETWTNILRSIPPILAPWTSRGLEYLAGYTGVSSISQYLNETKNFIEESEYRAIGNKLSVSFIDEVDKTMPEVEREAFSVYQIMPPVLSVPKHNLKADFSESVFL